MVKLAGCWEIGWNTPFMEANLWEFMAKEYAVQAIVMEPVSGIFRPFFEETDSLLDTIEAHRQDGWTIVFCDEGASTDLITFEHPEKALYVFGKASFSPFRSGYNAPGDLSVKLTTQLNQGGFWPHQAAAIVLHDRFNKGA